MSKGEVVNTEVLVKICKVLHCNVEDMVDFVETSEEMKVKYFFVMIKEKVWRYHILAAQNISPYKGSGRLTREQYLFYEMRITAKLMSEGLEDCEVIKQIVEENLFQYPTEKSIASMSKACIARLRALNDNSLIEAVAMQPMGVAKQICLYAMMKQYRLMRDFMVTVIGEKYRMQELSFGKKDVTIFFMQIQEQDDFVASWSESTIKKIRQVIIRVLAENGYLDNIKSEKLNPVLLNPILENVIRNNNDEWALPAFHCFL